jgi:hypothetical protein
MEQTHRSCSMLRCYKRNPLGNSVWQMRSIHNQRGRSRRMLRFVSCPTQAHPKISRILVMALGSEVCQRLHTLHGSAASLWQVFRISALSTAGCGLAVMPATKRRNAHIRPVDIAERLRNVVVVMEERRKWKDEAIDSRELGEAEPRPGYIPIYLFNLVRPKSCLSNLVPCIVLRQAHRLRYNMLFDVG